MRQVFARPRFGALGRKAEDWLREYTINQFSLLGSTPRGSRLTKPMPPGMLAIMLVAAMTLGAASVTTPALAFRGGGGGFHGGGGDGFRGGGGRGFGGFSGRGFGGFYGRGFGGFYGGGFGYYGGYPSAYPFYYYPSYYYPYYGYYSYGR
jgi:hypothetical protein